MTKLKMKTKVAKSKKSKPILKGSRIVRLKSTDTIPPGAKFLYAREEIVGHRYIAVENIQKIYLYELIFYYEVPGKHLSK